MWRHSASRFEGQAASRGLTLFLSHTPVAVACRQPEARDRVAVRRPRSRGSRRRQGQERGLRSCGYSFALPEQCVDLNIVRCPARLDPDQARRQEMPLGRTPRRMIAVTTSCATPIAPRRGQIRWGAASAPCTQARTRGVGLLDASSANTFVGFGRGAIAQSLPPLLSKIHVHSLVSEALRTAVDHQTDGITDARRTNSGGR
jgi:hypothetical protein